MEHQVGVGDVVVAAREPAGLEVVRRARARAEEQPLGADQRPAPHLHVRGDRHRLRAGVLDVDLEVVLEVLADAGQVGDHVDAEGLEMLVGVADARELEELRGVDRAAAQHDLAGAHAVRRAPVRVLDAHGPRALEQDLRDERAGLDLEVRPLHHRVQVGARGGEPPAAVDVAVERREALLAVAVDVVGQRVAGLLHRLEEGAEQRVGGRAPLEHERPGVPAEGVVDARRPGRFSIRLK